MIPVHGDYIVTFDGEPIGEFPVEAWADNGEPLVVGKAGLTKAGVVKAKWECTPVVTARPVAAVAAGGWFIAFTQGDVQWSEAIVGWALGGDGVVDPIILDGEEGPRLLSDVLMGMSADLAYEIKSVE